MYTEEYENRGFPFRNFLLKLILIIIFVFLLVWLLPKFITPAINKNIKNNGNNNSDVSALTSQIFADNLKRMKEAAISYYTDERLPQNEGDYKEMTLSEMIGLKIITPLIDKNNKAVDVEKSYVKITKASDEYILKVNLKDSEKEDYILVHLGCYTYCESNICEKKSTDIVVKGTVINPNTPISKKYYCQIVNGKYYSKSGNVVNKKAYENECGKITNPETKYYCVRANGKYYGKNGNIVNRSTYDKECVKKPADKYICIKVDGKYYDASGNVVSKKAYEKSCKNKPDEKHYCEKVNGKYYGKAGNVVDKNTYEEECTAKPDEKHYCEIVNGKYYDASGNVVSKEAYEKACKDIPDEKEYEYKYARTTHAEFTSWTKWTSWNKTSCKTEAITCASTDIKCLEERKLYERKEKIGTYEKKYQKDRTTQITAGSYQEKTCTNYNYVIISNVTYATTTRYSSINSVTSSTQHSVDGWTYNGRKLYKNPPRDTETKHYIFVGADYSYCSDTCTTLPNFYYDEYTYNGSIQAVSSTTTPISSSNGIMASCGGYTTKTVNIYRTITTSEIATRTEPIYGTVCYASTRTRELKSEGKTEEKWSHYNDSNLLNNNWYYTGDKRLKQ